MPAERAPMRKVREVLRLKYALGASERQIAASIGASRSTIAEYLRRAAVIGITWPVPDGLSDAELERRLFTPASFDAHPARPVPNWNHIHKECKRRGVTLLLLWEEYRAEHSDGYGYSRFCDLYGDWRKSLSPTMRQMHGPAEKLFVDFAGDTVAVFDATTGEERRVQIFVAVLGASNYTYAQGRWTQGLPDWIGAHVDALHAIGGAPKAIVCDNLKAGVTATCRYEPGHQSHLPGVCRALRDRDPAGPTAQAARQGEGGRCRADHRTLRARQAAQSVFLLARRTQCRHRRDRRRSQRQDHAQARGEPG
jgi:transposase